MDPINNFLIEFEQQPTGELMHLTSDDLLTRDNIFFIRCTHEGYFIINGDNDRATLSLMIKFAQLEFAGELSRLLKNTGVSKYQFKRFDYEAIADHLLKRLTESINK